MNVLVTGAWSDGKDYLIKFEEIGHSVLFMQNETDMLPCEYNWVEGVICNGLFLSHSIERFRNLRYIQLTSAGFDRVDLDYIKAHEIEIHNACGVYSIPMAEFAVCGVLQLYKQMVFFRENQNQHIWEKHRRLLELLGKKVLIIGCGSVGNECAKRFSAFGCEIIGVDLFPRKDSLYCKMFSLELLDNALGEADIIILSLPLTDQTKHLMNEKRFRILKNTAVIVNISRGAIIDTDAFLDQIDNIGGAVLDVFEEEPLVKSSPIWDNTNIIVSPHNSFVGDGNQSRLKEIIFNNFMEHK